MHTKEVLKAVDDAVLMPRAKAAKLLAVSIDTLRRMERTGLLTPIRLSGLPQSWVHYRRSEIEALLERRGVAATPTAPLIERETLRGGGEGGRP